MIIRYDKTLTGFCCLLGTIIKKRLQWSAITGMQDPQTVALFDQEHIITSNQQWAEQVTRGLKEKLGTEFVRKLGLAFLSEKDNIEADLIMVTRSALKYGRDFLQQLHHPRIHTLEEAALKTGRERHRLLGLIRFCKLADHSYFAEVEPRTNVIPLLGNHFSERFADQNWIICDKRRNSAVIGINGHWQYETNFEMLDKPASHYSETDIAQLWCSFYHNISNPQRLNPALRNQFMPKYYWRYLTEMQPRQINSTPINTIP